MTDKEIDKIAIKRAKEIFKEPKPSWEEERKIERIAMNIVYQIGDELKADVGIRQATNDKCIDFVIKILNETIQSEREQAYEQGKTDFLNIPMGVSQWMNYGKKWSYEKFFVKKIREQAVREVFDELELHNVCVGTKKYDKIKAKYV